MEETTFPFSNDPEEAALRMAAFSKYMRACAETCRGDAYGLDKSADEVARVADELANALMDFHIMRDK